LDPISAERSGSDLVDEDYDDVVDVVLLWWRDGDGDLVDALVDALAPLADNGVIWLLTPKAGRQDHVEPSDISEAAVRSSHGGIAGGVKHNRTGNREGVRERDRGPRGGTAQ